MPTQPHPFRAWRLMFAGLIIAVVTAPAAFAANDAPARVDHSKFEALRGPFSTGPDVTKASLTCHTDSAKQDDSWLYLPSLRRVRRLSTAQRSDALFGQDIDVDSYGGYAGQIPWFEWKFLGSKPMLASASTA